MHAPHTKVASKRNEPTIVRTESGATMGLVVVCAFVLVMIVSAFFELSMLFGGEQEIRNAVDAGTLNAAKEVMTLKVSLRGSDEEEFNDCRDASKQIGVMNINRVWAKAFLINANAQAMGNSGSSGSNASKILDAAQKVNDRLHDKVTTPTNIHPLFGKVAQKASVRMLGTSAAVEPLVGGKWGTSLVDRDAESNIVVRSSQLPSGSGFNYGSNIVTKDGRDYLVGYKAFQANNRNFWMVPFKWSEKPHLIAGSYFESNQLTTKPLTNTTNPVPNAYACQGKTANQKYTSAEAVAYAVANPQRNYDMTIAHGFIRIKLEDNKANWYVNGIPANNTTYGYTTPTTQNGVVAFDIGTGTLSGFAMLGNEYIPPTLWKVINALPGNHAKVMSSLLQRIREFRPDYDDGKLNTLLNTMFVIPGQNEYFIYPTYTNPDNTDATVVVTPAAAVIAPWLNKSATADGSESEIGTDGSALAPNTCWQLLAGTGCKPGPFWTKESGSLKWTPGSGYGQCLGTLRIERETDIYLNGACTLL